MASHLYLPCSVGSSDGNINATLSQTCQVLLYSKLDKSLWMLRKGKPHFPMRKPLCMDWRTYVLIQLVQLVGQAPGLGLGPVDVAGLLLLLPPQAEQLLPLLQLLSLQGLQLPGDRRQPACFHLQQAPTPVSCMAAITSSLSGSVQPKTCMHILGMCFFLKLWPTYNSHGCQSIVRT